MESLTLSDLKCNLFFGSDSFGRHYEIAIKNNTLYTRDYKYNGYGMGWTKWEKITEFSGTFYIVENKERLKWGWGSDAVGSINNRLRLPV